MNNNPTYVPVSEVVRDQHRYLPRAERPHQPTSHRLWSDRTNVSLRELLEAGFTPRPLNADGDNVVDDDGDVRLTGPDGFPYWYHTETSDDGVLEGWLI